jgi:RimJ/RimL family protein N-acetyltransferase
VIDEQIPYPEPPLRGTSFVLRPLRADDFAPAVELGHDEEAARWVPALPADDGPAVAAFYEACRREGGLLHLVVADSGTDAYLGEVMLAPVERGVGELGVGVLPAARGRGVATEALRLLAEWALDVLRFRRVQVLVATENVAALRLSERAGFRREGVLRSYWERDGARLDVVVLSRLPGDPSR